MASSPITLPQIGERKVKAVTDFIFLGSKITAGGDCSHEIKRCLLLRRKALTNPNSVLKSRDITLPTEIHILKAMIFLVVMDMRVGPLRRLRAKEFLLSKCGAVLGLQGDQASQF